MKLDPSMSIHGLLAAELTLNPPRDTYWGTLVPKRSDFESSTPFFWPKHLHHLLPSEATQLYQNQQKNVSRDWKHFHKVFPNTPEADYVYAWFLVSTRGFYYETPEMLAYPWEDRLALLPVADLFNHAATGCLVTFYTEGYTVRTDRDYEVGDEVCFSYGDHSNDFLLAEYGFCMDNNKNDKVHLDDHILKNIKEEQKSLLSEKNLLGGYTIDSCGTVNERTRLALHALHGGDNDDSSLDERMKSVLKEFMEQAQETQGAIENLSDEMPRQRALLAERWAQIEAIVKQAISK
jgi:hypothetical protein